MKYKNVWEPFSLNEDYWKEVLVNRTIVSLEFNDKGINCLILDNGEKVYPTETIMIEVRDN